MQIRRKAIWLLKHLPPKPKPESADLWKWDEHRKAMQGKSMSCDAKEFIDAWRDVGVAPGIAQNNSNLRSAVPDEIANSEGYKRSQQKRKRLEQCFAWAKVVGKVRQVVVRGLRRFNQVFVLSMAAYKLKRRRSLARGAPARRVRRQRKRDTLK